MANNLTGNNGCRGKPGPGRPKGSKNKVSGMLKDAILLAAENAGNEFGDNGLVSYLQEQAIQHPAAFMTLLGRVLPMQVAGELVDNSPRVQEYDNRQIARAVLMLIRKANTDKTGMENSDTRVNSGSTDISRTENLLAKGRCRK